VANGSGLSISHIGHSLLPGSTRPLYLRCVLHVTSISKHLAHDNNALVKLHLSFFCIKDQATRRILLRGRSHHGLYPMPCPVSFSSLPSHGALSSVTASADLWHYRLGHPSSSVIESVIRSNKLACAPSRSSSVCDPYLRAKVHQLPFHNSTHVTTSPLEHVHSDVWGHVVSSVGGFKFYGSFLDDFSRFTWIYLLKSKYDVEHAFHLFQKHVERLLNAKNHAP
jgi:hypothetical protein